MISRAESFEFTEYSFDLEKRTALFKYAVQFSDGKKTDFTETFEFPAEFPEEQSLNHELINACLYNLHLILGISYWKLYCPKTIIIPEIPLTRNQSEFWNVVYTKGLGEFFYKNKIDFRNLVVFPYENSAAVEVHSFNPKHSNLAGIGGGKDSIVAIEQLKKIDKNLAGFVLEGSKPSQIVKDVVRTASIQSISVKRRLDPKLFELNKSDTVYNGHIPISAIYAFTGLLIAALYSFKSVVVANEKSANTGNTTYLHEEINHQWSKSQEFEQLLQNYIKKYITRSIEYTSVLRNDTELKVIQKFCEYNQYFPVFSSCNRNFSITKSVKRKWCGECPKCAFVFAGFSAFLPKQKVVKIFDKNIFADAGLTVLFKQLAGLKDFKPFECVGTFEEVKFALFLAHEKKEFISDPIMQMFEQEILPRIGDTEELRRKLLS